MRRKLGSAALGLALVGGVAIGMPNTSIMAQDSSVATPDAYGGQVIKEVLVDDEPSSAPGETLSLTRFTIPAGAKLPVHMHPGVQMASVESGTLTYHVILGEVPVTRADGTEETFTAESTIVFNVGDSWEEPEGMVHYAENLTDEPVVLISTALLDSDEDATILVDATPAAATPAS